MYGPNREVVNPHRQALSPTAMGGWQPLASRAMVPSMHFLAISGKVARTQSRGPLVPPSK